MGRVIIFTVFVLILSVSCFGQRERDERRRAELEEFERSRIEYISGAMELSSKQGKVFWPLCREFWDKRMELDRAYRREVREFMKSERDSALHTEADYRRIVELFARKQLLEAELNMEYIRKFLDVLPAEKVFLFQEAERNFMRKLLNDRRRFEHKSDRR
jgi:hypothetical protein